MSPDEFGLHAARQIEDKIREVGPDKVAGVIGEPIQGAGGVIIPPATYWPEVERICREHGIPLIADEVICGFGRTGNWWGFETFGFTPDIVPMAKGLSSGYLPIGAVAVSDAIIKEFIELGGEFFHGYTYSGHPAACAVALENIRIIEDEGLVERVRDLAPVLKHKLTALADHPLVGEVRVAASSAPSSWCATRKPAPASSRRAASASSRGTIAWPTGSSCGPAGTRWCSPRRSRSARPTWTNG
jgi:putrescine---pyruvate transaminase